MISFPGFRYDRHGTLESEVESLRRDIAQLAGRASRLGADAYGETRDRVSDLQGDLSDLVSVLLPVARRGAGRVERVARDNPGAAAAVVGLAVLGLVATLVFTRR